MEEVLNNGEVQEIVQSETAAPEAQSAQETVSQTERTQEASSTDHQDKSWVKKLRRERDEMVRKSQMQEELIQQLVSRQTQAAPPAEEDILQQIQKEEYVPGDKVVRALQKQREEFDRKLEEIKKENAQQRNASMFSELKREFSDFDDVVNSETLAMFDETDPSTAQSIAEIKDPSKAARLAYKMIKSSGLVDKLPDSRRSKEVEKRLEQNKKTIQSPSSFDKRPMVQAFKVPDTKKEKEALWNETLKYASMGGGGY